MPRMQTSCPRCRQPVVAEIDLLFDVNVDPRVKQRLLSGQFNMINCPSCGYQGVATTPLVYHDPEKELLLTYFPPELGLPVNEQEKMIGPLINQAVNKLAPEKRKAYLFRPQTMFTLQGLMETILAKDGITREMLEAQQKRLMLLQRLITASPESRPEIIKQDETLMDESFFALLGRLAQAAAAQGDERSAGALAELQEELLKSTTFGNKLVEQEKEAEAAVKSLQEAGKRGLTREKLLDLIINAPTETRLATLVSLARSGLDYQFFQLLTDRVERSSGDQRQKLNDLRDKLLEMTSAIDKAVQEERGRAKQLVAQILAAPDIEKATEENLGSINELFINELENELQAARKNANLEVISKIQKVKGVIEKANTPPPEVELVQDLMQAPDEESRLKLLESKTELVNDDLLQMIGSILLQAEAEKQTKEVLDQLQEVYRSVLRFSMKQKMNK